MSHPLDAIEIALSEGAYRQAVTMLVALAAGTLSPPRARRAPLREPVRDADIVRDWLEDAAMRRHGLACHCLAWLYERGLAVDADLRKAVALYERAMAAGVIASVYRLGLLLLVEQEEGGDALDGTELLRMATGLGVADAAHALGAAFYLGGRVERQLSRAYLYLHIAAELGQADSQRALAMVVALYPRMDFSWERAQARTLIAAIPARRARFQAEADARARLRARQQARQRDAGIARNAARGLPSMV